MHIFKYATIIIYLLLCGFMGSSYITTAALNGFHDDFIGDNDATPSSTYWNTIENMSSANKVSGSHLNIQNNDLQMYLKTNGSWTAWILHTKNYLAVTSGRYFCMTQAGTFSSIYSVDPITVQMRIQNSGEYFWVQEDVVCLNITQLSSQMSLGLYSYDSSGNQSTLGTYNYSYGSTTKRTFKLELVDSTHARVLVDGVEVISSKEITSTLGSTVRAGIEIYATNTTNFVTYNMSDCEFN